jgi:hypothetical protein
MLVTDRTRETLRCRRIRRDLIAAGFEEIGEDGGHLWELHRELHRGFGPDHMITAVAIAPEGKSLFIKTSGKR